jgi:hypothetical protein
MTVAIFLTARDLIVRESKDDTHSDDARSLFLSDPSQSHSNKKLIIPEPPCRRRSWGYRPLL